MDSESRARAALEGEIRQLRERVAELERERERLAELNSSLATAEEERRRLATELAERAGELNAVLDSAPAAVWIAHDPQCLQITGNAYADQVFMQAGRGANISASAQPGQGIAPYKVFRHGVEMPPNQLPAQVAAATGQPVEEDEWELVFADGRRVSMLMGAVPLFDAQGRVRGSVTAGLDLSKRQRAEQALRESEAVLRSFFDSAGVMRGIVELVDGRIVHVSCNEAAAEMYGMPRESVPGKTAAQAGASQETERLWENLYGECRRSGQSVSGEYARRSADGRELWLRATASYLGPGASGNPRFAYTILDLTDHKMSERQAKAANESLELAQLASGAGAWDWDLVANRIQWSARMFELLGLDPAAITASFAAWETAVHPEDRSIAAARIQEALRSHRLLNSEYRVVHPDGQVRWISATGKGVYNQANQPVRMAGMSVDITERKEAEEKRRQSEEGYRMLFDTMLEGFCIIEVVFDAGNKPVDYRFLEINPAFESQTGLKDAKGRLMRDLAPEHEAHWFEIYGKVALTGEPARFVNEARALGRWYDVRAYRVGAPESRKVGIMFSDITKRVRAQEALRESESRLRTLADNLPEAAIFRYRLDLDGKPYVDFITAGIEGLTGVPAAEYMNDAATVERNMLPEDHDRLHAGIALSREQLSKFEMEVRHKHRVTGEIRRTILRSTPVREPDGSTAWNGIELDITERKRAEEALSRSERLYRAIGESLDYGVWVCDPDGRNTYTSESFLRLVGMTQEQCSDFGWGAVLHPEDAERTIAAWKECVRTQGQWEIEHRFRGVDGEWHPILARGVPVRDQRGQIVCWAGINLDISALKRAEEEIRRSNAVLEAFFEASPGILNIEDEEFRYLKTDRLTPTYFGLTRQQIVGKSVAELAPEFLREFGPMKREVIESGQPRLNVEVHFPVPGRAGEMAYWLASYFPLPLPEGKHGLGIVGVEITEIKKAEEQLRQAQKLESLGLLAGGVAHDFNNLLVGVIGNASLAQGLLPPEHPAAEVIQEVVKIGEQAAHLTRQMLAYSGKGKFLIEPLNLSAMVPEMVLLVRPSISKKIALHLDLDGELPSVEADPGQVQQVFMNLTLNAAEAIGSHDGVIAVRTGVQVVDDRYLRLNPEAAVLPPGKYVFLEVHDTGCGMDEATKARIFDPFFSTKFIGRGLGLAAVAGIVRGHKGVIVVSSTPGKGSSFSVLFPPVAKVAGQPRVAAPRTALQGSGVILVVDDEAFVRELAKRALERHGYTVLLADSGLAAIDVFKRHPGDIALVILDLSMPNMNGEEVLPELRKIRPEAKVVISSGYSEAETMRLFGNQKLSGFLQKPYTASRIAENVKRALA